jgi:hypothetical protein
MSAFLAARSSGLTELADSVLEAKMVSLVAETAGAAGAVVAVTVDIADISAAWAAAAEDSVLKLAILTFPESTGFMI